MVTIRPRARRRTAKPRTEVPHVALTSSDTDLALAYRAGSNSAGDILLTRHDPLLRSILRSIHVAPHVSRDDLLQIARIAFLAAAKTWNPKSLTGSKLTTYASVCVRRAVLRELDRAKYQPLPQALTDEATPDALACPESDDRADSAGVSAVSAVLADLDRMTLLLAHLTPRQRQVIEHRYGLAGREPATTWRMLARRLGLAHARRAKEIHDEAVGRLRAAVEAG